MVNCRGLDNMSLRFETTHRSAIKRLKYVGLPMPGLQNSRYSKIFYAVHDIISSLIIFYQLVFFVYTIMNMEDFQEKCRLGVTLCITGTSLMLTMYYYLYHKRFLKFFDEWSSLNEEILKSGLETEYFKQNYYETAKKNNSFVKAVLIYTFSSPFLYWMSVPLIDMYRGEYTKNIPVMVELYDAHHPGIYELTFILQMLSIGYGELRKFGNDCFFLALFRQHSVYIKYLIVSMKSLGLEIERGGNFGMKKKLEKWIKIHVGVIRSFDELISLFTPVICMYYVNLICTVVIAIFTQIKHQQQDTFQRIALGAFCLNYLFLLYMQCTTNEKIGTQSGVMAFEIYNIPWYVLGNTEQNMIKFMLHLSNKPVEITAFKVPALRMNHESFIGFIGSSITTVMTFNKISNR